MKPIRLLTSLAVTLATSASAVEISASTLTELQQALANAHAGDVVRLTKGSDIALKDTQLSVPEKITLNGEGAAISLRPGSRLIGVRIQLVK